MIGKMSAVLASAACAYSLVTLVLGFAPSVAAHAAQTPVDAQTAAQSPLGVAALGRPACRETWPYYEPVCLYDARQPGGQARVVRVVSIERAAFQGSPSRPR